MGMPAAKWAASIALVGGPVEPLVGGPLAGERSVGCGVTC